MQQESRVALVTGGAQGIGRAIAQRLLEEGWRVAMLEVDAEAGLSAEAALLPLGEILFVPGDVALEADVERAIAEVRDRWGRLDGLVCNAGIAANKPLVELSLAEWNHVLGVNLSGAFLCAKHAGGLLAESEGGGAIVTIASTRALQSEANTEAYSASKGGLVALTHALAISLGPAVRVNCISPGWIATRDWDKEGARQPPELSPTDHAQHPAGRVGQPEDVAGLAAWLLGPQAGFVTGANFVIDGGMTRKMIYV